MGACAAAAASGACAAAAACVAMARPCPMWAPGVCVSGPGASSNSGVVAVGSSSGSVVPVGRAEADSVASAVADAGASSAGADLGSCSSGFAGSASGFSAAGSAVEAVDSDVGAGCPASGFAVGAVPGSVAGSGDCPSEGNSSPAGITACSVAVGVSGSWALTGTVPMANIKANPNAPARAVRGSVDRKRPAGCERLVGAEKCIVYTPKSSAASRRA